MPAVLTEVAANLPGGGEEREGQQVMARAVARALAEQRHLVVQAGTGTGKSLAYLVPAALAGQRVVVATATKALQDQLATSDLPQVAGSIDGDLYAVLKGRSNYLCRQRIHEVGGGSQLELSSGRADPPDADDALTPTPGDDDWTGDAWPTRYGAWSGGRMRRPSVTGPNCPSNRTFGRGPPFRPPPASARAPTGAHRAATALPRKRCHRAAAADVVVVNTHLYGAHLASGGAVLPAHDVVVFDEAHEVEEVMTDSLGVEIGPGRSGLWPPPPVHCSRTDRAAPNGSPATWPRWAISSNRRWLRWSGADWRPRRWPPAVRHPAPGSAPIEAGNLSCRTYWPWAPGG